MTKAIDFDGVIHWYRHGWQGGKIYDPPMPGAIEGIQTIMETEAVVVFTARDDLDAVCDSLTHWGLECITQAQWDAERAHTGARGTFWNDMSRVLVTNKKPAATHYLDDRAVLFTQERGWDGALQDMEVMPAETIHTYLVTVKLPKNPAHNPRDKKVAACPANKGPGRAAVCTDHTGEHHTILVRSSRRIESVSLWARETYGHVTRIEFADPIILE